MGPEVLRAGTALERTAVSALRARDRRPPAGASPRSRVRRGPPLVLLAGSGGASRESTSPKWRSRGRARWPRSGVEVDFRCQDVLDFEPEPMAFDLVTVFFLQLPADERQLVLARCAAAVAPGGTFLLVGHDSRNATEGSAARATRRCSTRPTTSRPSSPASRSRRPSASCGMSQARGGPRSMRSSGRDARLGPKQPSRRTALRRASAGTPGTGRPCPHRRACLPAR